MKFTESHSAIYYWSFISDGQKRASPLRITLTDKCDFGTSVGQYLLIHPVSIEKCSDLWFLWQQFDNFLFPQQLRKEVKSHCVSAGYHRVTTLVVLSSLLFLFYTKSLLWVKVRWNPFLSSCYKYEHVKEKWVHGEQTKNSCSEYRGVEGKNRARNQKTTVQEVDRASGQNSEAGGKDRDVLEAGYVASGAEGAVLEASRRRRWSFGSLWRGQMSRQTTEGGFAGGWQRRQGPAGLGGAGSDNGAVNSVLGAAHGRQLAQPAVV